MQDNIIFYKKRRPKKQTQLYYIYKHGNDKTKD